MTTRRRQEGSILLVAMMALLVLAAIALVVVQNVTIGLSNMGSFRVMKQGYYLGEAGLTGPLAQAAVNQSAFLGYLENSNFTVRNDAISANFFDTSSWGSFGPEFSGANAAMFETKFSDPVDTKRIPGYSTGAFCYRKFTVTSDGVLGDQTGLQEPTAESVVHTAYARFVSHVYMGPFQCGY